MPPGVSRIGPGASQIYYFRLMNPRLIQVTATRCHFVAVAGKVPRDRDLGHLEVDIVAVADDLRAHLDQLFLQAGQRPALDRLGRRDRAQEITAIVGERMKLKPDGIGSEQAA